MYHCNKVGYDTVDGCFTKYTITNVMFFTNNSTKLQQTNNAGMHAEE